MAASTALNLSLLSRGIGEVKRNGSEKVDVIFEPQDYFNFAEESGERPFFLPPLQPRYGFTSEPSQTSRCISKDAVHLPKTFTTRKGALLLFSEDMAQKKKKPDLKKHRAIPGFHSEGDATLSTLAEESVTDRNLKTVEDLARSIMAYGNIDSGNMNLKVMTQRKKRQCDFERQIRPGFSAKRYLSTWTKTWDDTTLEKVISKGYLTEKSLFYYNPLLPHLTRRLNDDLSYYPTPYKLMRSMLMSPGSLSGYTFYRVRPESQETDYYLDMDDEDEDDMRTMTRSVKQAGSVKVASVAMDGQLQEAIYGQLDRQSQTEVLTDLLVKGAVHYAMKTQQEYADKFLEDTEGSPDEFKVVPKFDMREAVETMLQDNEQRVPPQILDANLPERDDRSQHSGSFKGSKLGSHRLLPRERGQGDAVPWHDDISSASSAGAPMPLLVGQAPLPPIGQTYTQLTPIGEASREHTQAFSLPVNDEEEDEGWAGRSMVEKNVEHRVQREVVEEKRRADVDKRKARISAHSLDIEGPAVAGSTHHMSSSDSIGPGSTHSSGWLPPVHKQQWKGSQQSLKSHGSRRAYSDSTEQAGGRMKQFTPVYRKAESLSPRPTRAISPTKHTFNINSIKKPLIVPPPTASPTSWTETGLAQAYDQKSSDESNQSDYENQIQTDTQSAVQSVTQSEIQTDTQSEIENQSGIGECSYPYGLTTDSKRSIISHRSGLSSDTYFMSSSGSQPMSRYTHSKSRLSSNLTNLTQARVFDDQTVNTESNHQMDRHSDTDIKIKVDQVDSLESHTNNPNNVPVFPKFSLGQPHFANHSTSLNSKLNSATSWRVKSGNSFGSLHASDDSDAEAPDEWKIHGRKNDSVKKSSKRESPKSRVTEQEILDKLTTHATHIAESILSHSESGQLLEEDIRRAAALWMDTHPAQDLSRSQSVQDLPDKTVIQEVMKVQKRNSAGPTVADYRDQIKGNLMMALAKATGLQQSDIPQDAEIDPELLEQLASHTLTPDDIEIVRDVETGRSFIRSRNHQISAAMGGVEKGHIYQSANNGDSNKGISIPSERKSGEIGELDIVNYQTQGEEKESARESKAGSEVGSKKASSSVKSSVVSQGKSTVKSDTSIQNADKKSVKSAISFKESQGQEELQQALADLDKPGVVAPTEAVSVKSGKSRVSDDKKSRVSEKEKRDEFVVASGVDHTKENTKLYGMPPGLPAPPPSTTTSTGKPKDKKPTKAPPVGKKKVEKGKKPGKGKAKKKVEHVPEPETVIEAVSPVKELTPEPPKAESPKPETPVSDRSESVKQESDEEEEYIFVREETVTPEPEVEVQEAVLNLTTSAEEEEPDEEQVSTEDLDDMSEADKLRMISNREARAAKRAAAAEKRRLEVDRKRKEREEQIRREKDEHERQEVLRLEQEELRKQKEEERRLKRQREEEENEEQVREELEKVRREKAEVERERRRKEEYSRKLEMMKARQIEDEKRRQEEAERKRLEEEEHHKEEEEKMAKMAEEERMEYERKKKEEEDERLRKEAEDKKRREEEAIRALEEARRLAEEMARKQAELEARLRFNRSLQLEANGLDHTQDITNAFVFSYFELLQWFGLDIAEFELLKLNQY